MNVYDFDKTIYKKDSSVQFYLFCIRKKPWILAGCIGRQARAYFRFRRKGISKEELKEAYFSFVRYFDIDKCVEEFVEKEIKNINEWYIDQMDATDVIISASPYFLVAAFMKRLGILQVIASDVDSATGLFRSPNCYGQEKLRRFQETFNDREINEFYTDSQSDFPLAQKAHKAFWVKGTEHIPFPK